jgi:hypothetical protein
MRLLEILQACESRGVQLAAKPSGLSVRGELTSKLREELKANKPNLLHYLRTGRCFHEMKPEVCKVCNGYVRRLIEEGMSPEWAEAEVLGKDIAS